MIKKKMLTDKSGELYEQYMEEAAKKLADDIDAEIMRDMLRESGWHEAVLSPMTWETSDAVDLWIHKNVKGNHWNRGLVWLFENESDAMWFKIRWMS